MPRPTIPDRRTALLDVAERLVLERGFDAVRIADIAADAGIGKGAVYLEFPSKEALLQALLVRSMNRMTARTRRTLDTTPDDDLTLALLYRTGVEALLADRLATAAVLDDRAVLGRQVEVFGPARYAARVEGLRALLRTLAEHGAVAADLDIDGLAIALGSATLGLLCASSAFGPLSEDDLARGLDALVTLVERGTAGPTPAGAGPALRAVLTEALDLLDIQTSAPEPA